MIEGITICNNHEMMKAVLNHDSADKINGLNNDFWDKN